MTCEHYRVHAFMVYIHHRIKELETINDEDNKKEYLINLIECTLDYKDVLSLNTFRNFCNVVLDRIGGILEQDSTAHNKSLFRKMVYLRDVYTSFHNDLSINE